MAYIPLLGRLSVREYTAVVLGFLLYVIENVLLLVIALLPKPLIRYFHDLSRLAFDKFVLRMDPNVPQPPSGRLHDKIRDAKDFDELCGIWGYVYEEHVVMTADGYLLTLHRLPCRKGEKHARPGRSTGKPVVYLHHGLLMNSEVWICLTDENRALPFVLAESGYDVWMGNNRGNKYSKKSIHANSSTHKFWDFCIDDFALWDIPDSITKILEITKAKSLSYVGFSQGTAQGFAALSIHPELNEKVNVFIALAPAMNPAGLSAPVVDGLMKASPTLLFLFFGRKSILPSALMWQAVLYPPIFARLIDASLGFLFNWHGANIGVSQKIAAYAHLYSTTSTKSVVHWFQIMRNASFQMYDDDFNSNAIPTVALSSAASSYLPARFPTRNIATPVVLLWGDCDSLVDINTMLAQLPEGTREKRLESYEHLDVLWGDRVHEDVIPEVMDILLQHRELPERLSDRSNGVNSQRVPAS